MLSQFSPATQTWFSNTFERPTRVQARGWETIAQKNHALLLAPTGSGKTLAAFLWGIDQILRLPVDADAAVRVLYISPLKALVYDIERNLRAPLVGSLRAAEALGHTTRAVRVDVRTGDTSQADRRRQARDPADILVTTPESLYLILGSKAAQTLSRLETIIVDEIHALAPTKRGAHLALSLERLCAMQAGPEPQRIGLSATVRPHDEAARYLGGQRPVMVVDESAPANIDLRIVVPVPDMDKPPPITAEPVERGGAILGKLLREAEPERSKKRGNPAQGGMWAAIYPMILALLRAQRSTIIFVNSRSLCERLSQRLNELAQEDLVRAHHGSLSLRKRSEIEESLKEGTLRGIVATSSLELGIDMGAVDMVVLVESPGSVARGLQRVGRAGHSVGEKSCGVLFPKFRGDLLESTVVAARMRQGELEPVVVPQNCLDVLSQQLVAMCIQTPMHADALHAMVTKSYPYHALSNSVLRATLDMLSGTYPSDEFADLRPHLSWDRSTDMLTIRRGGRLAAMLSAGTIVDRGLFGVFLVGDGPRVGELDEEMVHESRKGDTFLLGASTWRIEDITRDRVIVSPAPGEPGKMPFWRGEGPGRPIELGRALGAFVRTLGAMPMPQARSYLRKDLQLDPFAADNLLQYLHAQRQHTGTLPTDTSITIERFTDEIGDARVCILSPFGSRVHAPWALALEAALGDKAGFAVQTMYSDDGIVLRFADAPDLDDKLQALLIAPEDVEDLVMRQLSHSAMFASAFRENASRALLLPSRRATGRTPLWQQRLRAKGLLAAATRYPSFPIVLETYRQCLKDIFDLPALVALLRDIERREVHVEWVETQGASPFARSLAFAYVAAYLYEQDAPLAERKAQALTLDRELLSELLGQAQLRELLDVAVLDAVQAQLQHQEEGYQARDADELHDMLRRIGDLRHDEIAQRVVSDHVSMLQTLLTARRAIAAKIAGEARIIAAEDAGRYRDAFGIMPPGGLPERFLEAGEAPLVSIVRRFARTHGPFVTEAVAARYALRVAQVLPILQLLERDGLLIRGELRPGGIDREWCDADVLRRIKRGTLAKLRHEVAAVDRSALARFLPRWHHLDDPRMGLAALEDAVASLEGLPLPFSTLCQTLLPARVRDFQIDMLDMLCATGVIVWVGHAPIGGGDGRIKLYRRMRAPLLLAPATPYDPPTPEHAGVLSHLETRGACFTMELQQATQSRDLKALDAILWDLVWAGQITNDTMQPLRALTRKQTKSRTPVRRGGAMFGGRWTRVDDLRGQPPPSATEQAHARAVMLLERYGVVSREAAAAEDLVGGYTAVYTVLKAMEQSGKVRRGYFVEGLGGAQFAYPGAVERVRAQRRDEARLGTQGALLQVVSAIDPANAYGSLLPWPERPHALGTSKCRRQSGAVVALLEGDAVLYAEHSARHVLSFPALWATADPAALLVRATRHIAQHRRSHTLHLQSLDGVDILQHPQCQALVDGGMLRTFDGLMISGQSAGGEVH